MPGGENHFGSFLQELPVYEGYDGDLSFDVKSPDENPDLSEEFYVNILSGSGGTCCLHRASPETASDGYEHFSYEISLSPSYDNFYFGLGCNNEASATPEACPPYQVDNFKVVWHIPVIVFSKQPKHKTTSKQAKFAFDTDEPVGTGFECSIDGEDYETCLSPRIYHVSTGQHVFRIRGAGGAEPPPPETVKWKVVKDH